MFRELFFRKGFRYDNIYDWDILALPSSEREKLTPDYTTGNEIIERPLGPSDREMKPAANGTLPPSSSSFLCNGLACR
jgi:hypothetical protein